MDNLNFNMDELRALVASTYSGGNSFAARSARAQLQRRDDEGKFAKMFGAMRISMLLNGLPVSAFSNFVGGSTRGENMGWFYVKPGDPSVPAGFYRYPVDRASNMGDKDSDAQAILGDDYLASKGIDRKNPVTYENLPRIEDLEFQEFPPDFVAHPDIEGAFISEDGDITIEPNPDGGFDVVDNIDPANKVQNVDNLVEAMRRVAEIDKTRKNYVPAEGEAPVAELPSTTVTEFDETVKSPESMSNQEIDDELQSIQRMAERRSRGLDAETLARRDALEDESDLRSEDEETAVDPNFVRVPEAGTPAETPVAELPATEQEPVAEVAEEQTPEITIDRDGEPVNKDDFDSIAIGSQVDVTYTYPDGRKETKTLTREGVGEGKIGFKDENGDVVPLEKSDVSDLFRQYSEAERDRRSARADAEREVPQQPKLMNDGGDNQPPVAPEAPAEEPEDFDALEAEILEKYPLDQSNIRQTQHAMNDRRPIEEALAEIDAFVARLRNVSDEDKARARSYLNKFKFYRDITASGERTAENRAPERPEAPDLGGREPMSAAEMIPLFDRIRRLNSGRINGTEVNDLTPEEIDAEIQDIMSEVDHALKSIQLRESEGVISTTDSTFKRNLSFVTPEEMLASVETSRARQQAVIDAAQRRYEERRASYDPQALGQFLEQFGVSADELLDYIHNGGDFGFNGEKVGEVVANLSPEFAEILREKIKTIGLRDNTEGDAAIDTALVEKYDEFVTLAQNERDFWNDSGDGPSATLTEPTEPAEPAETVEPTEPAEPTEPEAEQPIVEEQELPRYASALVSAIANMKATIQERMTAAEATGDAQQITRLKKRFGYLNLAENFVRTRSAENADYDVTPSREYILENMRLTDVVEHPYKPGYRAAKATYVAPNGITYELYYSENDNKISARILDIPADQITDTIASYTDVNSFMEAGRLSLHDGEDNKDTFDDIGAADYDLPVHDFNTGQNIVTPSMIEIHEDEFRTLGSAMHVFAQAMVEANGNIYRHSSHLLPPGRRTVLRVNGQDPNMAPYNMREKLVHELNGPTAEVLRQAGMNDGQDQFARFDAESDVTNASGIWWGEFDHYINMPLFAYGRYLHEKFHGNPNAVAGEDYPRYFEDYINNPNINEFEFTSLLNKFHELNYEDRDVDGFISEAEDLIADIQRVTNGGDDILELETGGADGDESTTISISYDDVSERLQAIVDVLKNNTLGAPIERVNLVGTSVIPMDLDNEFGDDVSLIIPKPKFKVPGAVNGATVINPEITLPMLRIARTLDDIETSSLEEALKDAIRNLEDIVVIRGKGGLPIAAVNHALSLRGVDSDMLVAKFLDENGGAGNVDALNEYRQNYADIIREGGNIGTAPDYSMNPVVDESGSIWSKADLTRNQYIDAYAEAVLEGKDSITVRVANYGDKRKYGYSYVEVPVEDFRSRMDELNLDYSEVEDQLGANQEARDAIAETVDMTPEQAEETFSSRADWRDAIRSNSDNYRYIAYIAKDGQPRRFERREGGWTNADSTAGRSISNEEMIRKMDRDANRNDPIFIDSGFSTADDYTDNYNSADYEFTYGSEDEGAREETVTAPIPETVMHVTGADLDALRALERQGVAVNVMDKMRELFPNAEQRDNDELVTEKYEWTAPDGTQYRYEVVVTRTADEYFYTYVRQINLTDNVAWSSPVGRMSQSAHATLKAYVREVTKFRASFFKSGGPTKWMESGATRRARQRDLFDADNGGWQHFKNIAHNPQTLANIRALLGEEPATSAQTREAEDAVLKDILDSVVKYRLNDTWMRKMATRIGKKYGRNISPDYMYRVADAYDAHLRNQNNIEGFGTWVSFDQSTPLDAGDYVEHVSGRRGTVRKRLGWVESLQRYVYTDYVEVLWEDGNVSWTTSRNNRLIQTASGTDGRERVSYRDGISDPRAVAGTQVADPNNVPVPDFVPAPAQPPVVERVRVTRNENSELVLPDGTVIPEKPVGGTVINGTEYPDTIQEGMFISVLNDDLEPVMAPVIRYGVDGAPAGGISHEVAVRNADGTYTVKTISYTSGEMQTNVQTHEYNLAGNVTPAQVNELLELLGSKVVNDDGQLPAGLVREALFEAVLNNLNASQYFTPAEFADILNEIRALPDRNRTPVEDASMLAREASIEAERNGDSEASDVFGTLADGADIVASQPASEESENTPEEPSAPEAPAEETPAEEAPAQETPETPEEPRATNENANPAALEGTQILDAQWLSDAPAGTRIYSTSSGRSYELSSEGTWKRIVNGQVTDETIDIYTLQSRIATGQLFVGGTAPTVLPPGSQTSAAAAPRPSIPRVLSEVTPDVSGGWADVSVGTQINNPEWFAGAPTGTEVGLSGINYKKKEDGLWYPTSGDYTSSGYSSDDLGALGLLSRSEQEDQENTPQVVAAWELLPEGSIISENSYIDEAPIATRISLQLSDGSAPRAFVRLGNGQWELEGTTRKFTSDQIIHRLENSGANTFTSLPSADTSEVQTEVTSLSELRAFPDGTYLSGSTSGSGQLRYFRRVNGNWEVTSRYGRGARQWDDARVMQFIREGGVVNNGNQPNRFSPSQNQPQRSATSTTRRRGATAPRRGGGITPITYTPGTFETDVTPEQFHQIISSGNSEALKRLLLQQFDGKMLGNLKLTNIRVGGSSFEANIADSNGNTVGSTRRSFTANPDGTVSVYNALMSISSTSNRGGGFSSNYTEALYDMYRKLGVTKVRVSANIDDGGYAWGAAGFDFTSGVVEPSIKGRIESQLALALSEGRMQDALRLNMLLRRIEKGGADRPTAFEIATVQGQLEFYPGYGGTLGRELMAGTHWGGSRAVNTLEESLAFFDKIRRKNEERQRQQEQNGWNS